TRYDSSGYKISVLHSAPYICQWRLFHSKNLYFPDKRQSLDTGFRIPVKQSNGNFQVEHMTVLAFHCELTSSCEEGRAIKAPCTIQNIPLSMHYTITCYNFLEYGWELKSGATAITRAPLPTACFQSAKQIPGIG
ncbi:MAG TPA: hypothetical protein PLI23_12570, partial [Thermoclostridium caenicola]|uniref:hypothetical protein n=1 Tax=Thermoclostridium caenicola TaxID=659425 RepID=UPI002C5C9A2B